MINVGLISLGCSKNQVDSEIMLGILAERSDINITTDLSKADILIINTCGFIEDAKEESIKTIIEAIRLKNSGNIKALIVSGCLIQRYKEEIMKELPEVDAFLGTGTFTEISDTINRVLCGEKVSNVGGPSLQYRANLPRKILEPHFAYVKIAEGCNNNCTYCSIPQIRGPLISRPIEDIFVEVTKLVTKGVKEIILVAQDTTQYGIDLCGKSTLKDLLKKLVTIADLKWIRLMYCYPEYITDDLIDIIACEDKICNYFDLPIQHSSKKIRKLMNRNGSSEDIIELVNRIRSKIPDAVLRTTLIVGFPGEDNDDFSNLISFIKTVKFDRLGVFKYSKEDGTAAAKLPKQISAEIKEKRFDQVMKVQQQLSYNNNQKLIGQELLVLIDDIENKTAFGRTQYDAPEVDTQVYLPAASLKRGDMVLCKIKDAFEYDLIGEIKE